MRHALVPTLAALLIAASLNRPAFAAQAPRAIWTWEEESYAMLDRTSAVDEAITFFKAHGITTVYLYADSFRERNDIVDDPKRYKAAIKRLHGAGLQVYALLGSGYLQTERYILPAFRAVALAMVRRVFDYNAKAEADERFDGINLDIEPHILDEWSAKRLELLGHFLDMSAAIMEEKRRYGQALDIGPAMPFWWDGIELTWKGKRRRVSEHAQDLYDYVALMDYRDHAQGPDGLISHASDEIAYGLKTGKRVLLGVETTPNEIQKVSFNHLTESDMERELAAAEAHFKSQKAFGGFVVHHYRGYRQWLERQNKKPANTR